MFFSNYIARYAYSSAGELSQISYPSGLRIYYRRNASGQITGIDSQQPGSDKPIVPFVSELAYTALGQPRSWRWASGATAARAFDADGRMAGNEFASYSFDAASRITGFTRPGQGRLPLRRQRQLPERHAHDTAAPRRDLRHTRIFIFAIRWQYRIPAHFKKFQPPCSNLLLFRWRCW